MQPFSLQQYKNNTFYQGVLFLGKKIFLQTSTYFLCSTKKGILKNFVKLTAKHIGRIFRANTSVLQFQAKFHRTP